MTDREFWLAIRAALKAMVAAIERKYLDKKPELIDIQKDDSSISVSTVKNGV